MKDRNLLASVALFGQLYNSEKYSDISSILGEFIKGAVVLHKKYHLTSFEVKKLLEDTYDFQIPESVLRTVMFSTLKNIVVFDHSLFNFNESITLDFQNVEKELEEKNLINDSIFKSLKKYVEEKEKKELSQSDESVLFENFNQFLFDNGSSEKYTNHISSFIIKNEAHTEFVKNINSIREGLILYQGIRFTADLDKLGKWKSELVIYLNTEYLFNALGYNGILFKDIFFDFYKLVQEINSSNEEKTISLKYFSETQDEIESFFVSAESILKGHKRLKPWKTAMKMIIDGCSFPSDIVAKKVNFYSELDRLGIEFQEFNYEIEEYASYNVEDTSIVEELKKVSKGKKRDFDEESCYQFFRMFTKVNFFRKGKSCKSFEGVGHIFITDSGFGKYLGHNNNVKFSNSGISFAKDIDFVTTRFWIKLKKGFSEKIEFPKSFNVLTKAKIIISSQINYSMSKEFDKLVKETEDGKLTKEEALERSYALREKPNLPGEINENNIDSTFEFLNNESYLDNIYREKERKDELIKETQRKNIELQAELERRDKIDEERKEKERLKSEENIIAEKKKKYESNVIEYNRKIDNYCEANFSIFLKESKNHFWRYFLFIILTICLIFILVSLRDSILSIFNIEITEDSKLHYSGLIMVIGFLATTIRSFFDTKNFLKGFRIITSKKFKIGCKKTQFKEFEERFKMENQKPIME